MENFKKQYRELEMRVLNELRIKVAASKRTPKNYHGKSIMVEIGNYTELALISGSLFFLDDDGLQYSVFTVSLEDLIDILDSKS